VVVVMVVTVVVPVVMAVVVVVTVVGVGVRVLGHGKLFADCDGFGGIGRPGATPESSP
jgi:hypothetical protein